MAKIGSKVRHQACHPDDPDGASEDEHLEQEPDAGAS
jgi:hypothetical protein